jgi:hypothetical protein
MDIIEGEKIGVAAVFTRNGKPARAPEGSASFSYEGAGSVVIEQAGDAAVLRAIVAGPGEIVFSKGGLSARAPFNVLPAVATEVALVFGVAQPDV